jgi:hypothetical protein
VDVAHGDRYSITSGRVERRHHLAGGEVDVQDRASVVGDEQVAVADQRDVGRLDAVLCRRRGRWR